MNHARFHLEKWKNNKSKIVVSGNYNTLTGQTRIFTGLAICIYRASQLWRDEEQACIAGANRDF